MQNLCYNLTVNLPREVLYMATPPRVENASVQKLERVANRAANIAANALKQALGNNVPSDQAVAVLAAAIVRAVYSEEEGAQIRADFEAPDRR